MAEDQKRREAGQKLLSAAMEFWQACHAEGQYGAVQWIIGSGGELLIYTRGEYRDRLMANIGATPGTGVHHFSQEAIDG